MARADEAEIRRGVEILAGVVKARLRADPLSRQGPSVHF
jgi:hypothetical protein